MVVEHSWKRQCLLCAQVNMGEMSVASQTVFAYLFFVSKARESDEGLANMYKHSLDVFMACALTWTFLPDDVVPLASYAGALLVLCAVVTAEVLRLSNRPRPPTWRDSHHAFLHVKPAVSLHLFQVYTNDYF
ncbi:hypothetical protein MRX96_038453 [Rhipicephalus microplus]